MANDLKPCPFCNSPDVEVRESITDAMMACNNCGCRTGFVYLGASDASNAAKLRELVEVWNARTPSPSVPPEFKHTGAANPATTGEHRVCSTGVSPSVLSSEVERVASYLRRQGQQCNRQQPIVPVAGSELLKAADMLEARPVVERLREALTDIRNRVLCPVGPSPSLDLLAEIASAALTDTASTSDKL